MTTQTKRTTLRRIFGITIIAGTMIIQQAGAISITSVPTFTPSTAAPLSGVLNVGTDVDSRVSLSISDGIDTWQTQFYDFGKSHSLTLLGFKPSRTNQIIVTVYDKYRNSNTATQAVTFVTGPLPIDFAHYDVLVSEPERMEPGYTLFIIQRVGTSAHYITIMDKAGDVVWYCLAPALGDVDVRQLPNGDLFMQEEQPRNDFREMNLLGGTVRTWPPPPQYPVNIHEGNYTDHGTILYVSDASKAVQNFPSSVATNATLITKNVDENPIVEISVTNSALLNVWSPLSMMNPTRITYLTYQLGTSFGVDNEHVNAIIEDKDDNSIIISLRDQNALFKFTRSSPTTLKWILGPHENWGTNWEKYLLTPTGAPFTWNYGQHAPKLTPDHTLLVYDDGNAKASPFDPPMPDNLNHSRAVEFSIDETNMTVTQLWDTSQVVQDRLFTQFQGDVDWLPQKGNVLVTYGNINFVNGQPPSLTSTNATMVRLMEYTHDPVPEVVFDVRFFDYNTNSNYRGYVCYRSERISDYYPHPIAPVRNLVVSVDNDTPLLQFSADPTHAYTIEASTDLVNWAAIGTPMPQMDGDYDFFDMNANQYSSRFYRVVTQP